MSERREIQLYANQKKLWDTRWTPNNKEFRELVMIAVREAGSMVALSRAINLRYRHLRRIIHGEHKAVSFRIADQILARSSVAHRLRDLEWITVEELVERGIWKEQMVWGRDDTS